ncbi:ATP-binding cassette domain-containing protein [Nocardia stercoris]|uniref:ATP-binding cassette domain-containing protein n=2 Tax=Nocardia stercoris TaxID=2483361 RepID=A0A3M2LGQ9_9NOCA|nr:ATP-binding cassette domain-containing protein [Nocardia stercoris]
MDRVGVSQGGVAVLADVDAVLPAGRCTAIVGASGTGKTTLLRLLNRLAEPDIGMIALDGVPIADLEVRDLRRRVGLVAQTATLLAESVGDEIRVGRPDLTAAQVTELLAQVGLPEAFAFRLCAELSGGEAQRVCLARGLAVEPEWLLLDEPTSALDADAAAMIRAVVRRHCDRGGGVVLVSHDSGFTGATADSVLHLDGGRLQPLGSGGFE